MNIEVKIKPNLSEKYRNEVIGAMQKEFGYKNVMQVPKLKKIVLNMGVKEAQDDVKILDTFANELTQISGQKPLVTRAKKSIAGFKLRENSPVGLKVTLRGIRMYEFFDRLVNVAMPRIRDFQGYPHNSFDNHGNYSFGIQEQIIFPEVDFDKIRKTKGMDVTLVTSATTQAEAKRLLELLGFPFRKN